MIASVDADSISKDGQITSFDGQFSSKGVKYPSKYKSLFSCNYYKYLIKIGRETLEKYRYA